MRVLCSLFRFPWCSDSGRRAGPTAFTVLAVYERGAAVRRGRSTESQTSDRRLLAGIAGWTSTRQNWWGDFVSTEERGYSHRYSVNVFLRCLCCWTVLELYKNSWGEGSSAVSRRIEARALYVASGGDPPRSHCGRVSQRPSFCHTKPLMTLQVLIRNYNTRPILIWLLKLIIQNLIYLTYSTILNLNRQQTRWNKY